MIADSTMWRRPSWRLLRRLAKPLQLGEAASAGPLAAGPLPGPAAAPGAGCRLFHRPAAGALLQQGPRAARSAVAAAAAASGGPSAAPPRSPPPPPPTSAYLDSLSEEQVAAVTAPLGATRVVAGERQRC